MNALLYLSTVLIWGTTWIAIKVQLGPVPIPLSIAYRFFLAAAALFAILAWRGQLRRPRGTALSLIAAQGLTLFCFNFLCFYYASHYLPSGLVAVVFSTATLWNALNARLILKRRIAPQVMAGGALGLAGIATLFWPQLAGHSTDGGTLLGLGLSILGTLCFSAGNLLSARLQALGHTPLQTNAWAMLTGALILFAGSLAAGLPLTLDTSPHYLGALLYLAIPGSVIGFTAYLMLVGRLGPERAAYCTVLFPVVALNVSVWLEGYRWTPLALAGLILVLAGNVLVFRQPARRTAAPVTSRAA
ncbi:DMT family transporter [Pseudogulbenkiania subflava]|uniref:Threonine/homoserine efflux transporter RhtA n=1 Tax=Pseudogulbenkiania subflava DSM 22618 TaxID=1123014 RepID=A0A1Y6C8X6_9NEIS|nr:EamA family transporter [Pseudogulbenkiania subflava]SMF43011.1 Threonine/homoserine efflux transporter RhtA [Pseudogulbenkiania subflava DSM 22618]